MSEEIRVGGHNNFPDSQGWKWGWQLIPGTPIEIGMFYEDPAPGFRIRCNEYLAREWFEKMFDQSFDYIQFSLGLGECE